MRNSHGILAVYDISNRQSFERLEEQIWECINSLEDDDEDVPCGKQSGAFNSQVYMPSTVLFQGAKDSETEVQ